MAAAERFTPGQIKKTNRQLIYDYIYQRKKVSQQDIAYALRLSRPTVASNLSEMEEAGLVRKNGQLDQDQIGRKAMAYSVVPDYRIAIGAELTERGAKVIAITQANRNTLSRMADYPLFVPGEEKELRVGAMTSRTSGLLILDLLYLGIAKHDPQRTEENLRQTRDLIRAFQGE